MSDLTTIEKIAGLIGWYEKQQKDYSDISSLIHWRKKLATLLFSFAGEVGDLFQEFRAAEFRRKNAFDVKRAEYIAGEMSAAAAEAKAKADISNELKDEMVAEGIYKKADLLRMHAFAVLDSMNQHIAALKQERNLEKIGQGT